jgi:hypothetical protein
MHSRNGNHCENKNMKKSLKVLAIAGITVLGFAANSTAQVQQSISFSLTVYNQTDNGVRALRVSDKDVIENLAGTKVPGGHLWLVMPDDPGVDGNGTIGAFLRVTDAHGNIIQETTTDSFNIYQNTASLAGSRTYAWNGFSLSFGGLGAELYGTAIWSKGARSPGGLGTFHCSVSGYCALSGMTDGQMPCSGSIGGGAPKPAS